MITKHIQTCKLAQIKQLSTGILMGLSHLRELFCKNHKKILAKSWRLGKKTNKKELTFTPGVETNA
jgi:hypothetical protein